MNDENTSTIPLPTEISESHEIKIDVPDMRNASSFVAFYIDKLNDGYIIADDTFRKHMYDKLDIFWRGISSDINEKYKNPEDIIDNLSMHDYMVVCLNENKKFIYEYACSEDNKFAPEHKELTDIVFSADIPDDEKLTLINALMEKCRVKYTSESESPPNF